MSTVVAYLTRKINGCMSVRSVESLMSHDKISFEATSEALSNIEGNVGVISCESESAIDTGAIEDNVEANPSVDLMFKDVKLGAMLELAKKDNTMLYQEYTRLENLREEVIKQLSDKLEPHLNVLLNEIKSTGAANDEVLDKLIDTDCGDVNFISMNPNSNID